MNKLTAKQVYFDAIKNDDPESLQKVYDEGYRFENEETSVAAIPQGRILKDSLPIIKAFEERSFKALKWLAEHGADWRKVCPRDGLSVIDKAWRDVEALEVLKDFSESAKKRWEHFVLKSKK